MERQEFGRQRVNLLGNSKIRKRRITITLKIITFEEKGPRYGDGHKKQKWEKFGEKMEKEVN